MTPGEWGTLVGVALGSPLILSAAQWIYRTLTGREARKKSDNLRLWEKWREMAKHAARLEMMLVRAPCVDDADIPPWPESAHPTGPTRPKE